MTATPVFVGIDVAKDEVVVALAPSGEQWVSGTEGPALATVVARVREHAPALVVLEATGGLEAALVALGALLARRRQLVEMLVAEQHRLARAEPAVVGDVRAHIHWLRKRLGALDDELQGAIKASPVWRVKEALYRSVPSIGPVTALTLIAELPELGTLNRKRKR
jgi:transposase